MHSRFAWESLTSCNGVQGPALVLVHIYGFVQYTRHSARMIKTIHGGVGGWAGTYSSGMGW